MGRHTRGRAPTGRRRGAAGAAEGTGLLVLGAATADLTRGASIPRRGLWRGRTEACSVAARRGGAEREGEEQETEAEAEGRIPGYSETPHTRGGREREKEREEGEKGPRVQRDAARAGRGKGRGEEREGGAPAGQEWGGSQSGEAL